MHRSWQNVQHEGKSVFNPFLFVLFFLIQVIKASENLTFIQNRSVILSSICELLSITVFWLGAIKDSVEEMALVLDLSE